jgi:hypothetical protein
VAAALSSLKYPRDIFGHRIRRDEAKVGGKTMLLRERRLFNGCGCSQCSFYRERPIRSYVISHEALALSSNRAPDIPWYRAVAAQDLGTAIIDVEGVNPERCHGKVGRLAAAGWTGNDNHARTRHSLSAGFECCVRAGRHV